MYLEHFGFQRFPFTIAPDPDFLFPSSGHQEALAHLQYALTGHGGLICLTGEVGTGKTTLCRAFLAQTPAEVRTAYLFNPQLSATELLQSLCDELGLSYNHDASLRELYALLNKALLEWYAAGQRVICVIDEAQSMPPPLLEQIRLLTNLETHKEKLLTLILVGQPELRELLARHDLRQLSQRITARYHLQNLSLTETRAYLRHRCALAGVDGQLFSPSAARRLWRVSGGVPRLINNLADRALLGAYARGGRLVDVALVKGAEREILGHGAGWLDRTPRRSAFTWLSALIGFASMAGLLVLLFVFSPALKEQISDWRAPVMADPVSPLALLTAAGLAGESDSAAEVVTCEQLQGSKQCLWVDWPWLRLQGLSVPVAVQMKSAEGFVWQRFSADLNPASYAGQALLLWQPPAGYSGQLVRPGQKSDLILWIRRQLNMEWQADWLVISPEGQNNQVDSRFYDPLLANRVAQFQAEHGLSADKIIGPETLLFMQQAEQDEARPGLAGGDN